MFITEDALAKHDGFDIVQRAALQVMGWNTNVNKVPGDDEGPTQEQLDNQYDRVKEELITELKEAQTNIDFVDAVCDSFVVVVGYMQLVGGGDILSLYPYTEPCSITKSYELLKNEEWVKDNMRHSPPMIIHHLINIILNYRGADCVSALKEILDNNESKFIYEGEELAASFATEKSTKKEPVVVRALDSGEGFWLCRERDNKVVKPPQPYYHEVDISRFVY